MNSAQKPLRFIAIGVLNTLIDFAVLIALTQAGLGIVLANIIATSVALTFSFVMNRRFTFRSEGNRWAEALKFLAVTLFGLWVLQTLVLVVLTGMFEMWFDEPVALVGAKIAATIVSTVWNYLLYDRLVFRSGREKTTTLTSTEASERSHGTP